MPTVLALVSASVRVHSICPDNVVDRHVYLTTQEGLDVVPIAVDWTNGKVNAIHCERVTVRSVFLCGSCN